MDNNESLSQAVTALQAIQTDDTDVQTQVANALTAVQAAQASQGGTVEDPTNVVTFLAAVDAFVTAEGWTAPVPNATPTDSTTTPSA